MKGGVCFACGGTTQTDNEECLCDACLEESRKSCSSIIIAIFAVFVMVLVILTLLP